MRTKTRKTQRGGNQNSFPITEEVSSDTIFYTISGPIPKVLRNAVRTNRANRNSLVANLAHPRTLSTLKISMPNDFLFKDFVLNPLNKRLAALGEPALDPNTTVEINRLQNEDLVNIQNNKRRGTKIKRSNIETIFNNSVYTGPSPFFNLTRSGGPLKGEYFLQKGMGQRLLNYFLDKVRRGEPIQGIRVSAVVLVAANRGLVPYYQRFGFVPVEGVWNDMEQMHYGDTRPRINRNGSPVLNESGNPQIDGSGPVMYLRL
jgi:hypothetical protein